ncbi:MAG: TonB-dependent receptor [Tannerellaceae bacterium]|nr:TonB-dependent receptor [Tannerellaceae bacterium]
MRQFKVLFTYLLLCIAILSAKAQGQHITGKVVDPSGEEIIGANVSIKGTTTGTVTDFEGNFSLQVPASGTLVVSYIGYKTYETPLGGQSVYQIRLSEDSEMLDDIIVVGYGVQKKATLTGSVSQVRGDDVIKGKATTSVASALQGTIPGLTITRTSSRPGNEDTSITLRGGMSTNKDVNPLILIDGVEAYMWELSQMNPADIESISVLKDASASIYGNKAGAGVILVTTKRGKAGKTTVTYNGSVHANILGKRFPVADGVTWANMFVHSVENDAIANNGVERWWMWSEEAWKTVARGEIYEGIEDGRWRHLDPYVNHFDEVYGTTWGQNHNVSINAGNDKLKVLTSLGYSKDRSLVDVVFDGQRKYNFRTNVDYKINQYVKTEFNVSYDNRLVSTPTQGIGNGVTDFYLFPLRNPFGQFYDTFSGERNVLSQLIEGGRTDDREEVLRIGGKVEVDLGFITKGLSVSANGNWRIRKHLKLERQTQVTNYDWAGESVNGMPDLSAGTGEVFKASGNDQRWVKNTFEDSMYKVFGGFINYNRDFSEHTIGAMLGMTADKDEYKRIYAFRKNMPNDEINDLNTGDATSMENAGDSYHVGTVSYVGRLNYDYKGTYLIEGVFRRDGSSRFNKENRWANFLGASAGIRLSELDFIKTINMFDNLKVRGSYGETGSQAGIGYYDYISTIKKGTTVTGYNGTLTNTAWIDGMTSLNRSWERVKSSNIGLDFAILNNRLSGVIEYFVRKNDNMFIQVTFPQVLGEDAPKTNDGSFQSKGWEVSLQWQDKIGTDFYYNAGVSLSDARTKVTGYNGATVIKTGRNNTVGGSDWIEGKPLNAIYVYKTDGYLQNQAEVDAYYAQITQKEGGIHPIQGSSDQLIPGSVRRVDVDGDGRITQDDLVYYGDANPHYEFGINLGARYKGFDFNIFMQGVGQMYVLREGWLSSPFNAIYTNQNVTFWGNTWTPDNPNARYPVISGQYGGARNTWNYKDYNDININNCWYMRAKNVVLGYTLPKSLLSKVKVDNLRLYVAADNLFEFSNVKDGFDPETKPMTNQGNMEVFARTISFGIDITF